MPHGTLLIGLSIAGLLVSTITSTSLADAAHVQQSTEIGHILPPSADGRLPRASLPVEEKFPDADIANPAFGAAEGEPDDIPASAADAFRSRQEQAAGEGTGTHLFVQRYKFVNATAFFSPFQQSMCWQSFWGAYGFQLAKFSHT